MEAGLFGLSAVAGVFLSGFFLWRRAKEERFNESDVMDVYLMVGVWALVASRVAVVIQRFDRFGLDPLRWVSLVSLPGLDPSAALVMGAVMIALAALKRKWNVWLTWDVFLQAVMLWEAVILAATHVAAAVFSLVWFLLLSWVEREYRLWDWYKARRGNVRPGLVACTWAIGQGILLVWLAGQWSRVVFLHGLGAALVAASVVAIVVRAGRIHL